MSAYVAHVCLSYIINLEILKSCIQILRSRHCGLIDLISSLKFFFYYYIVEQLPGDSIKNVYIKFSEHDAFLE